MDKCREAIVKGQDIFLLIKLVCLESLKIKDIFDAHPDGKVVGWLDNSTNDDVCDIDADR